MPQKLFFSFRNSTYCQFIGESGRGNVQYKQFCTYEGTGCLEGMNFLMQKQVNLYTSWI